ADESLPKGGPGRADNGNFALTDVRIKSATISFVSILEDLKVVNHGGAKLIRPRATFEQKGLPIAAAIDSDKKSGWAIDPQVGKNHAAIFEFDQPLVPLNRKSTQLTITLEFNNNKKHSIGRLRFSLSTGKKPGGFGGSSMPLRVFETLRLFDDPRRKI